MNEKGFSLVELLVAMAIASVLGVAGVALFATSNWTYKVNEDVSEAQQNVRVAMEALAKDIRTAGFGLEDPPTELTFTGLASTFAGQSGGSITLSSPITVTNNATGADTITILGIGYQAGVLVGSAAGQNGTNSSYICYKKTTDEEKIIGSDNKVISNRRYVTIGGVLFETLDTSSSDTGECGGVSGSKKLPLSATEDLSRLTDDTPVFIIQAVQYTVATNLTGCSSTNPCLASYDATELRGSGRQAIADSIEDIQFAFGIDVSPRDSKIDDYNGDGFFTAADFVNDPADDTSIVAVRANVVAKTRNIDMKGGQFSKICQEDRSTDTGCTNAATDGYRRRLLTKVIKLRNPRSGGS